MQWMSPPESRILTLPHMEELAALTLAWKPALLQEQLRMSDKQSNIRIQTTIPELSTPATSDRVQDYAPTGSFATRHNSLIISVFNKMQQVS